MDRDESRRLFLLRWAYFVLILALCYAGLRFALAWLLPFVTGFAIAALLRPASLRLSKATGLSERVAGCIVLLFVYALAALALFLCGAALIEQVQRLAARLPALWRDVLLPSLTALERASRVLLDRVSPHAAPLLSLDSLTTGLGERLLAFSGGVVSWLGGVTAGLPDFLMTFLFTVACSLSISAGYRETALFIARQFPPDRRRVLFSLKAGAGQAVKGYCKAYALLLFISFSLLSAGLLLLGVEDWLPLAALGALLDLLPLVGTGLLLLPWALACFLSGNTPLAAGLALLWGVAVTAHSILEPKLVGRQLGLHPLVSLVAVYAGYRALGFAGMIAVPVAVQLAVGLHRAGLIRLWK